MPADGCAEVGSSTTSGSRCSSSATRAARSAGSPSSAISADASEMRCCARWRSCSAMAMASSARSRRAAPARPTAAPARGPVARSGAAARRWRRPPPGQPRRSPTRGRSPAAATSCGPEPRGRPPAHRPPRAIGRAPSISRPAAYPAPGDYSGAMEAYDAVIAGAGPAGLAMAAPLAEAGLAVLVCERNAEIGLPVRTSGGSWPDDLRALGLPDRLWHPISRLSFESLHSSCTIDWGGPVGCSLDVTATWRHLAELATAAGATIENGTLVRLEHTGALTLRHGGESRHVRCRLAVDATGTNALLARQSRVHEGFRRVGVGYEQELSAPAFGQDEAVILVGGLAPSGYAWAFPRGGTRVRVGVGLIQPDTDLNPRELYAPVERALADRLAGAELLELHSGRIPSQEAPL